MLHINALYYISVHFLFALKHFLENTQLLVVSLFQNVPQSDCTGEHLQKQAAVMRFFPTSLKTLKDLSVKLPDLLTHFILFSLCIFIVS